MIEVAQTWKIHYLGTDITTYDQTGAYAVDTNEGGYGSPNADRNTYALVVYPRYIWSDKDPELVGVKNFLYKDGFIGLDYNAGHSNTHISSIDINTPRDGVYDIDMILVPTTVADAEGNIRYNTTNTLLEIYTSGTWVELTDFDKLLDPLLLTQANCSEIVLHRTTRCVFKEFDYYLSLIKVGGSALENSKRTYQYLESIRRSAFYNHRIGKKLKSQILVEGLDDRCNIL